MIMARTKKGYSVIAEEKDGKELVMELLRASCEIVREIGEESNKSPESIIQELGKKMLTNTSAG